MNKSYFTKRQDRYIHFSAQPALAQYCFEFLQTVSTFSYKLLPSPASSSQPPPSHTSSLHSYYNEEYTLQWPDPHTHPHHIHRKAETAISAFQARHRQPLLNTTHTPNTITSQDSAPSAHSKAGDNKIILFPTIQAGQFNIREEESALALLFRSLNHSRYHTIDPHSHSGPKKFPSSELHPSRPTLQSQEDSSYPRPLVDLTSGYFGLYKPYQDLILASPGVDCRVVAASPKVTFFSPTDLALSSYFHLLFLFSVLALFSFINFLFVLNLRNVALLLFFWVSQLHFLPSASHSCSCPPFLLLNVAFIFHFHYILSSRPHLPSADLAV